MREGMTKHNFENEGSQHEVVFTRHSKARYRTAHETMESENPQAPFDPEKQVTPDLSPEGERLAKEEAKKFFDGLEPGADHLFFVSSNEARAIETANIYRQIAKKRGFDVLKPYGTAQGEDGSKEILNPEPAGNTLAERIGEGEIRILKDLSLNSQNTLLGYVFSAEASLKNANLEALDADTKEKWDKARQIINGDDRGSWGDNFFAHSEEIKEIFPAIKSAYDLFRTRFNNLLKLARFGLRKARGSGIGGNVKILAFGHENYMASALETYFNDHEIENCESIAIEAGADQGLILKRRGEEVPLNEEDISRPK
jgi:hypothetical protein